MSASEERYWSRVLHAWRAREGMTQAALAELLQVDQTAISRWERGVDTPSLRLRRKIRDLNRSNLAARQDHALRLRVRNAWNPSTLLARGAVFLEVNDAGAQEAHVRGMDLRGKSLYGLFGAATDEVTKSWERTGIFDGALALAISVNRLETGESEDTYIRTVDTPYFTSDGEVWCLSEIKQIDANQYQDIRRQWGGSTFSVPFDTLL
jgi:transcriptional regulator with XRE-family HTH domain